MNGGRVIFPLILKNSTFKCMLEYGIIITSSEKYIIIEHKGYLVKTQDFYYCTIHLLKKDEIFSIPVTFISIKFKDKVPKYPFICVN